MGPFCSICRLRDAQCPHHSAPRTYEDIRRQHDSALCTLDLDLQTLSLIVPYLSEAWVTTRNDHALILGRGSYLGTLAGDEWQSTQDHIPIRMSPDYSETTCFVAASVEQKQPDTLYVLSRYGRIQHRIDLTSPLDSLLFSDFASNNRTANVFQNDEPSNVISLASIRYASDQWAFAERAWHADHILLDGGKSRRKILPHIPRNQVRAILPEVLDRFLLILLKERVPFSRLVSSETIMQADNAPATEIHPVDSVLIIRSERGLMAIDRNEVDTLWQTRFLEDGQARSALEAYDRLGRCIAVFWQKPGALSYRWQQLVSSLPGR